MFSFFTGDQGGPTTECNVVGDNPAARKSIPRCTYLAIVNRTPSVNIDDDNDDADDGDDDHYDYDDDGQHLQTAI